MTQNFKLTPMFEQYLSIKKDYPNSLLFFRMGDFFELFFEDAAIASRELQLTLTCRNPNIEAPVPMCGLPHQSLDSYLPQLLEKGYKVVICDQVEAPKEAKGLVKRAVTRVLTPSTVVEELSLSQKQHNYLGALYWDDEKNSGGFAWADNSTGSWSGLNSKKISELWQWVQKLSPKELLLPQEFSNVLKIPPSLALSNIQAIYVPSNSFFHLKTAAERILKVQGVRELSALGLTDKNELTRACGALLTYLEQTHRQEAKHLLPFIPTNLGRYLIIDEITERNLEIFQRLDGKKGTGTLLQVLDETITPMGGRLLEERMRQPWRESEPILETQTLVQYFYELPDKLEAVRKLLKNIYDLERLSTRICLNRAYPKDFIALGQSLVALPLLYEALQNTDKKNEQELPVTLKNMLQHWDNFEDICALLCNSLNSTPPQVITEGSLFNSGYSKELDELIDLAEHGEARIQALWEKEKNTCNLPRLKLGQNRIFGYYFELGHSSSSKAPEHFVRRQTLAGAERYTTVELGELEQNMMLAAEKRNHLEYTLFNELREKIAALRARFMYMAQVIATLDYWQGLAQCAKLNGWVKPVIHNGRDIKIRQGRHPVVEQLQGKGIFIPNDLFMDEKRKILLITGPNMSGKSTVLRQTAIICMLAQMGSFVPATEAEIGLTDRIFSRVGASDNLAQGQSTFMVEMMETARILRQAGKRSLVILDEIGRGTSTYDGLALAWAVVEDLCQRNPASSESGIRTLFATHYHELTILEETLPGVHNMNVAIREMNGELVFLRRLVPGPSNRSYGIEVARLAGVPAQVVQRARQILENLDKRQKALDVNFKVMQEQQMQMLPGLSVLSAEEQSTSNNRKLEKVTKHPLLITLADLDINQLSPMRALGLLHEWKNLWGETGHA
jgi:DNA mismatch repair protein MutS